MNKPKSIKEALDSTPKKKRTKKHFIIPRIGHCLAIVFTDRQGKELGMEFIDAIDICDNYTVLHTERNKLEIYPVRVSARDQDQRSVKIYYTNNTILDIYRIN